MTQIIETENQFKIITDTQFGKSVVENDWVRIEVEGNIVKVIRKDKK